eukprot:TRINITY_DN17959_c0_g1_i2.p1 TRINITY_DN17959_c0_g1~~TRINITY_DN17959_c0_g1_i2.p1  ORF type:complete len:322 (-),score=34.47 TRINITY_DN17959_c0_g1_i2:62-1027(-)
MSKLSVFVLDQSTHVVAEFMAFMWRDCTKILFAVLLHWLEVPEERRYVAAALCIWGLALVILGLSLIAFRRRMRVCTHTFVHLADSFEDVDTDMVALPAGWTFHAALNTLVFGCEWEELVEKFSPQMYWYFGFAIIVSNLAARLSIWLGHRGLKENSSVRLHVLLNTSGFMNGFLLSVYFSMTIQSHLSQPLIGEHLKVGHVIFPFAMLLIGSRIIVCMRTREGRYTHSASEVQRKRAFIMILAYQVCMSLAFEEMFDKLIETFEFGIPGQLVIACASFVCWLVWVAATHRAMGTPEVNAALEEAGVELQSGTQPSVHSEH